MSGRGQETRAGAPFRESDAAAERSRLEQLDIFAQVRAGVTLSPDAHDEVTRLGLHAGYDRRDAFIGTRRGRWGEFRLIHEFRIFKKRQ